MHLSSFSMSKIRLSSSWQLEKLQLFFPFLAKEHNGSWCLQCLCFLHISREDQAASLLLIFDFFPRLCFAFDWSTWYVADLLQQIELDFLFLVDVNLGVFVILFPHILHLVSLEQIRTKETTLHARTMGCHAVSSDIIVLHNRNNRHGHQNTYNKILRQPFHAALDFSGSYQELGKVRIQSALSHICGFYGFKQ